MPKKKDQEVSLTISVQSGIIKLEDGSFAATFLFGTSETSGFHTEELARGVAKKVHDMVKGIDS